MEFTIGLETPSAAPVAAAAEALVASAACTCEVFTRTRFVHGKVTAMQCRPVKLLGGILCFLFCGHGHEGEARDLPVILSCIRTASRTVPASAKRS